MSFFLRHGLFFLLLVGLSYVHAEKTRDPCQSRSETQCIDSSECKLIQTQSAGKKTYSCRSNINECEKGFIQRSGKAACESQAQCSYQPSFCYCPPGMECRCGGGKPAMCGPR
jgi:hypothetical protein